MVLCAALALAPGVLRATGAGDGAGTGASSGSPAESQLRDLADRVLARSEYQTELPGPDAAEGDEADPSRLGLGSLGRWTIPAPSGLRGLLELLAWVATAAVVVLVLTLFVRSLGSAIRGSGSDAAERDGSGGAGETPDSATTPPLDEAERLAAAGRYGEAAHALLVRALRTVAERSGQGFPESATSREILDRRSLAPGVREPLAHLVRAVERFLFGGAELGADEWERCRASFAALEGRR